MKHPPLMLCLWCDARIARNFLQNQTEVTIAGVHCSMPPAMASVPTEKGKPMRMNDIDLVFRLCGSVWVFCNGDCSNCNAPTIETSNRTEPNGERREGE